MGKSEEPKASEGGASGDVADYIRSQILNRALLPGQWIRQELIANETGASRLPVREALRILEGEGLVTITPNRGARVTVLDPRELDLLYGARASLEPLVIAESANNLTEAQLKQITALVDRMDEDLSPVEFLITDREFHLLTYAGCPSKQLLSIIERLWNSTQQYRRAFITSSHQEWQVETRLEHRLLARALVMRSGPVAARLLDGHITRTREALGRRPEVFEIDADDSARMQRGSLDGTGGSVEVG